MKTPALTSGELGNYLMGALPNATFIGFTGIPIYKTSYGKDTPSLFSGKMILLMATTDKHCIAESVEEDTNLP